jgi:hypothetical protein
VAQSARTKSKSPNQNSSRRGSPGGAGQSAGRTVAAADPWPCQLTSDDKMFSIFQPQYERWDQEQGRLEVRAKFAGKVPAWPQSKYGFTWFTARTQVDQKTGMVTLDDPKISRGPNPLPDITGSGEAETLRDECAHRERDHVTVMRALQQP